MKISDLTAHITSNGLDLPSLGPSLGATLPAYLGASFGQQFNKLTTTLVSLSGFNDLKQRHLLKAIGTIGSVLEDIAHAPNETHLNDLSVLWAQVRAGWFNANPSLLVVVDGQKDRLESIEVMAFAKEGFISQKTAPGAIRRFEQALRKQEFDFDTETIVPLTPISTD
jgi:hypothetical protein